MIPKSSQEQPQREHAFKQMEILNQVLACGFLTPEAVLEEMKNPLHVRRFDICVDPDSESTTNLKKLSDQGYRNTNL